MNASEFTSNLSESTPLKRLQSGLASTLITQVLVAIESFLLVPLFLRAWGIDGYGEWITLTAFIGYLMLMNLGVQNYVANLLTMSYAAGDLVSFKRYLNETVSLFVLICTSATLLVVATMALPGITIPGVKRALILDQRLILIALAASYSLSVLGGVWTTPYQATGRYARGAMLGNAWGVIKLVILITALFFRGSPLLYALLYLSISLLRFLYYLGDMHFNVPEGRQLHLTFINAIQGRHYLGGSVFFWLRSVSFGISQQGVISVLGASLSTTAVSLYATHRTASGLARYPFALFQGPLWPELSMLGGQQRFEKLREVTLLTVRVIVFISGLAALAIWVWLPVIYSAWTSNKLELESDLLALFLFQVVLFVGWSSTAWPLLAINQHKRFAIWDIVNAVFTILLSLILVKPLAAYGVALATLLGDILCGFLVYPRLTAKYLNMPILTTYRAILTPMLSLSPVLLLVAITDVFMNGWSFAIFSSLGTVCVVLPLSMLVFGKGAVARAFGFLHHIRLNSRFLSAKKV